ncbi:MAG: S46 family peptidase [bacterium]
MLKRVFIISLVLVSLLLQLMLADEGMYPISALLKLNLKAKGLKIDVKDLYNPKGGSLIEAIVHLGGCTGSFVSKDGLIITNHHCVFGAVSAISTAEKDYLTNGFLAKTRTEEIAARGLTARITEQIKDVSKEVLTVVKPDMDPLERSKAIENKIRELTTQGEKDHPGKSISISEMLAGKSYVMFISTMLRDVRLVYVPPRAIGEFGGENDNWVWPRHTGDFSFVRAYVGPDGKPAAYSEKNVPYNPKRHLKVNSKGVNEEDFVFILGYPGRTFRHQTSYYMAYEELLRMPFIANLYEWQINTMEELSKVSRAVALKHDSRIKGLANTMKNYKGKIVGMKRMQLVAKKAEEEKALQLFIEADAKRKATYGTVLEQVKKIYDEMSAHAQYDLVLDNLASLFPFRTATSVNEASQRAQGRDSSGARGGGRRGGGGDTFAAYYEKTEKLFLKKLLSLAAQLPQNERIAPIDEALGGNFSEQAIDQFVEQSFAATTLFTPDGLSNAMGMKAEELEKLNDPFVKIAKGLAPLSQKLHDVRSRRTAELSKLSALLVDVKQQFLKKDFIPDANSTLRFTFGHIRGYSPADATYYAPITTLKGVIEKTTGEEPFVTPQKSLELYKVKDFGQFKHSKLNDVPVAILYDMDTTGGNSGSPVMNARGELVGVNFDRAFEATINDYAWSESYSRSIAVDIRYVLWVTEKVGGAKFILEEVGVK